MDADQLAGGFPGDAPGELRFATLAALAGACTGLVGSIFHLLIDRLIVWPRWLGEVVEGWALVGAAAGVTLVCAVLSAFLVRRVAPEAAGSGVQEIEGAMEGLREVRWRRVLPTKFVGGVVAIGSGLALGREGPTIHIGASISAASAEIFGGTELERRGLLAAGAAAGLACAFNAPVAAVLFIIEETHDEFPYTFRTYMGVIVAALASTFVTQLIGGTGPDLPLSAAQAPLGQLPLFFALGAVLGVVGAGLNASIMWATALGARCQRRAPYLYTAAVGLAVGALFILLPWAVTGGESVILEIAPMDLGVGALLVVAALRFLSLVGSYSSGVPGGVFAPILALAACVGLAFAGMARLAAPDAAIVSTAFAIAAMGGLFTASVRAPIVGVALTMELTGSYALAMPLMATCVAANLVAQWSGGRPLYAQLLERTLAEAGVKRPADRAAPKGLA
ncbi:H(+)/Cl(-) exchange transporter ClcA [Methylocella sp.]|uniref:H(+)/Cl(-) exchange transporter ClcA n=1 Tax=Methylocella sp. TaxID=1978226 RepID=UPI0037830E29